MIVLKNKIRLLVVVLICAVMLTACASASKDLTAGKSAEQIVTDAFTKWSQMKSYELDLTSTIKMKTGQAVTDMSMTGNITVFQNPLKIKLVMETTLPETDKMHIVNYMEQLDGKVIIYQQMNGQWQKTVIDDPAMAELMSIDPAKNLQLFMDNLKKAETTGEEKIGEKNTVKIELISSSKIFNEILNSTAGSSLGIPENLISSETLAKIGDMKNTIWVDKATLEIVQCQMDLTENMKNLGNALSEEQNLPKDIVNIIKNMEMALTYTIRNHNQAQDFTIPDEAKNA
ncbi:DUF6612 family protein [Dehalobacter sp. DCM]|uniref:DUF6612 family protein n=1 Tax=Dehalobacter sp. DCM TaxID=2907827 RepID=UPI003FCD60AA